MPKQRILVTRKLPDEVEKRLIDTFATNLQGGDFPDNSERLIQQSHDVDGILCSPCDQIGADLIEKLPERIRIISTFSVGYEHIDIKAAMARGITVTNTPGVLTDATADIALLLILGATRRAFEGERLIRENKWQGWNPTQLMGTGLQGKRLGILGMGRIGQAVANRAKAFGMEVHYHNRRPVEFDATYHETAESLLSNSDVLSLHCPLTPETKGFLSKERIELLPQGAVVINTARGGVIEDEALIEALKSKRLFAAGLDVFEGEPNLHAGYRALDNTFLLPHLGSATIETRNAMGFMAIDNLESFFKGESPPNVVKP
ncbi:Glycerate dehydrogenase [Candidatus Terasakiella magnetica]|uniref:Glycerate dehydrogenase n=1 Tax=Candidatus Terasakiella magnetica TaxID=1867952 RepID=A0A1C3RFX8_9PROT|nr:D-glycerate dehydrogenase [Candidatus Terasakiella magnetica]SCA56165.1 Glycerate dehydrogenase [Candidatus Terasakiella magnetica]